MLLLGRGATQMTFIPIGAPVTLALFVLLLRRSTFHFALPMTFSGIFLLG
jgi:hypothetical protein